MNEDKEKEISKDFIVKFDNKFYEIARLADRGDDEGYGKGLARLQIEIKDYLIKTISQSNKALLTKLRGEIKVKREKFTGASSNHDIHKCGYNDALDDIEEHIALIDKYLEQ